VGPGVPWRPGVTTARDCGNEMEFITSVRHGGTRHRARAAAPARPHLSTGSTGPEHRDLAPAGRSRRSRRSSSGSGTRAARRSRSTRVSSRS
jgi:hypothetical protein